MLESYPCIFDLEGKYAYLKYTAAKMQRVGINNSKSEHNYNETKGSFTHIYIFLSVLHSSTKFNGNW